MSALAKAVVTDGAGHFALDDVELGTRERGNLRLFPGICRSIGRPAFRILSPDDGSAVFCRASVFPRDKESCSARYAPPLNNCRGAAVAAKLAAHC